MGIFSKIKELNEIMKSSGIVGVRNNIEYEVTKLDDELEYRKGNMNNTLEKIRMLRKLKKQQKKEKRANDK